MCVAYPGEVLEVNDGRAIVETDHRRRPASLVLVPDVTVGDWVIVSAGIVLEKMDAAEAHEILALLQSDALEAASGA